MKPKPPTSFYAERAYRENQEILKTPSAFPETDRYEEAVIILSQDDRAKWEMQSYETIDDWSKRITRSLSANQEILDEDKDELATLIEKEQALSEDIQSLLQVNEQLEQSIAENRSAFEQAENTLHLVPPFKIHLVQKGETLYSLAMKYYGSAEAVPAIMQWNRGWIRYPNVLLAGVPLVLYSNLQETSNSSKMSRFILSLQQIREHTLADKASN
jgi:gas vesicle protein/phage tail protein X